MARARDNQKRRVYDSEIVLKANVSKAAQKYLVNGGKVRTTGSVSIEACQQYVDDLTSRAWFQRRWGRQSFQVKHKVSGSATGAYNRVTLPPWARDEKTILHEVAHSLIRGGDAWHGPEFAGVLLTLVKHVQGAEAAKALRAEYKHFRVRYSMAAVPAPSKPVVKKATVTRIDAKRKAEQAAYTRRQRLSLDRRETAAASIREAVDAGWYGPPGAVARRRALATARTLEFPGKDKVASAAIKAVEDAERQQRIAARQAASPG